MGDRANIALVAAGDEGRTVVYLYTHWNGHLIERYAADGLALATEHGRLTDPQYGGRIVTEHFLRCHHDPGLGAGVSGFPGEGPVVEINFDTQEVSGLPFADFIARYASKEA